MKFLSKILKSPEAYLLAIASGLIEFKIEGVLWQSIASIVVVAAATMFILETTKSFKSTVEREWLEFSGMALMFAFVAVTIFNPVPAHAILIKAQAAMVAGINSGIQDPVIAAWVVGTLVTVMWLSRAILLGYAIKIAIDVNEGRKEEQPWKDLMQKPLVFILAIVIINQIGTMLTT